MKKKINNNKIKVNKVLLVIVFFLLCSFIVRLSYLCLVDYKVEDSTITAFIKKRNIEEEIILPQRGTIKDKNGNILAQTVASYTLIAYLDESRSKDSEELRHVEDKEKTAEILSDYINMTKEEILALLNKDAYQVELGPGGRNLSQMQMEKIKELNLAGIDFTKSLKRYYPNGDFASYLLGYTVNKEDDKGNLMMVGELGIEEYYNSVLTGEAGYRTYEKDRNGYKIANGREYVELQDDGDDIYLTIDNTIELFIENAVKKMSSDSEAEWSLMIVADAKTGAILGYSSTPSFDPNLRNMTSYIDPIIGNPYEPGSTMKTFSHMCAIDSGNYDGDTTYESGSKTYESETTDEKVTISDWNKEGWGTLTYDKGFALSSNIAVANILETVIDKNDLKMCYEKYGFGEVTGINKAREQAGSIDFKYQIEAATAGYGQGITTTPIQHIQALSAIANDGVILKTYIIDKIVNSQTGKTTFKEKKEEKEKVASTETIEKLKELMRSVISPDSENTTGAPYYMEGYDLIGKTGTAQIFDYEKGKYMDGDTDYIYSFSGLYPGEDPEIIIYTALKKPKDTTNYIAPAVKDVVKNISNYLNIEESITIDTSYEIDSYISKNTSDVVAKLNDNNIRTIVLGNGNKVIEQYPSKGNVLTKNDLVILLTNNYDRKMPDFTNLSYKDALNLLTLMDVDYNIEGNGYVYEQNIEKDTILKEDDIIELKLKEKYN